jgi:hypothetical protein
MPGLPRTGEWKRLDRPDAFPKGPELKVKTKGGFHFEFRVFDHFGQMVNRAKGTVRSGNGQQVGTGVYIVAGSVTVDPAQAQGPAGGTLRVGGSKARINVRVGYVR